MSLTVDPHLEARLRERAEAEGISVSAYVERLIREDDAEIEHTEALLEEAVRSGEHVELTDKEWDRLEGEALTEAQTRAKRPG
jgi:hypothetical protein